MKVFETPNIKNTVLLGHSGCGKTTFAECMLFESGNITRRGTPDAGNTVSDYHELEKERGHSVFSTLLHCEWHGNKINVIDTPGLDDFIGEVIASLRVADTGIMLLNAQSGVEVGTEIIWEYTEKFKTPMIFVVNHIDQDKADFELTVEQAKNRFGQDVTVVQYPMNQGKDFNAIIDVLKMVMYKFPKEGGKPEKLPIPDQEKAKADKLHNELIESIASHDDGLMEKYFDQGVLSEEEMAAGLKAAMIHHDLFPLFVCSAKNNMGSGRIMGFLHDIAPSAQDVPPVHRESGATLLCDPKGPTVAFVYKTISEPHLGEMSFFKLYSGKLKMGDELINNKTGAVEKIQQIFLMNGKQRDSIEALYAGDIGATVKLKNTHTNNTLHPKGQPFNIEPIHFPESRVRVAITTPNKADVEKMATGLHTIQEEDPTAIVEHNQELRQVILNGQGDMHLQIIKWKIEHNFKIPIVFETPKIPYRETIQKPNRASYRHKKQSGGAGQFAEVHFLVEPYYDGMGDPAGLNVRHREEHELKWGGKMVFYNCIVGGAIDAKFMSAIVKGIMEKIEFGPLTGSYVRDVRVSVFDGKMHPVDSNDQAFKTASMWAFKEAFQGASPKLLEPICNLEIMVPDHYMGDVMSDMQTRRGIIMGMDSEGHYQKILARAPLSELSDYSSSLRSFTHGRAKYTMRLAEYEPVPMELQDKLVKEYQAHQSNSED